MKKNPMRRVLTLLIALLLSLLAPLALSSPSAATDIHCEDPVFRGARFDDKNGLGQDIYHVHVYARYRVCYDFDRRIDLQKFVRVQSLAMCENYVGPLPWVVAQKPTFLFTNTFTAYGGRTFTISRHIKVDTPDRFCKYVDMRSYAKLWVPLRRSTGYVYPRLHIKVVGSYWGPDSHHSRTRVLEGLR